MEIKGEQIIKKGKRMPKWIFIGYVICIAVIIYASVSMEKRQRAELPEAIDFTTDGALGMEEGKYAYLEVQGLTDEIATYGSTDDTSDSTIDRYCVAYNNGYWYVVDLNLETIDELKDIKEYTYSTDENAQTPNSIKIYGMTEKIPDELKTMLIDYYNQGVEEENKIATDDFERYFGSTLLNVRKSPVDTTAEEVIIFFAMIGMIIIFIYNISIYIIKQKIKNYLKKNDYENELAKQLDDNVEEKHYRDMVILTKDFLVDLKSNGGFSAFKYSDVKWIHIHSVKYYGIITTSSSIIVHLNDGKTNIQCIKIKGGTTDEFLDIFNKICEKVPTDCLKGYTQENIKAFKEYKKENGK
ncbi:putative uncharacterized protein [Clostridium sp. CAG:356]|nr:putative uncharacterized protein [Clostridium sp. CAG:356]